MKLSEVLKKDWPNDHEIDRDELASILYSFKCGHGSRSYTGTEKLMLIDESYCEADHIISTMPTWLKRIEK